MRDSPLVLEQLPLFMGKAYRVDIPNWGIPRDATVADMVRFEQEELGNTYDISPELMAELGKYHYSDATWVTKTKEDARNYLSAGMSDKDILEITSLSGGRIITENGMGGYLVLKTETKEVRKMAKEPLYPHTPGKKEPLFPHVTISEAETQALRFAARERDFVATVGLSTQVEPVQLKSGKWRAYLRDFVTPGSPRGQEAETKEVVRDGYDNIITGADRADLIAKLKAEYPSWRWKANITSAVPSKGQQVVLPQTEKASAELKYFWVEKNLPYDTWAIIEAWPGGMVRSPFNTKEEAIKREEEIAEGIWQLKQVPSPQEKFPKQHEALKRLYPYIIVEYHDDGDLTIRELVSLGGERRGFNLGKLYVVTTDGQTFEQEKSPGKLPHVLIEGGELVPPQYHDLVGLVSEPLPKEAY